VRAVILVGGFGTRLRPLTLTRPKQMLPVVHVTMLERVVGTLGRQGVTEAVLSLGYRQDVFVEAFPDGVCAGVRLHYAVEPEPLDTAGAIRFAAAHAGVGETFVAVNGDVLTDVALAELLDRHRSTSAAATIALTPVDDPSRYGVVPTDEDGRVLGFVEKPPRDQAPTTWINAGMYVLEPSVLDRIPAGRRVSIERETFPQLVDAGGLYAVQSDAYWVDAGTPETYLQVQLDLLDGRRGPAEAGVHPEASVDASAVVRRSVVGPGAVVAAGAVIEDAVLFAGATVGEGAQVRCSVVGTDATVGAGAVLDGLSVVGDGEAVAEAEVLVGGRRPASD
jgi:mannose-1-phosphate guanylyltransferase